MQHPYASDFRKTATSLIAVGAACLLLLAPPTARSHQRYYSMADFAHVQKVDAHMHIYGPANLLVAQAKRDRFHILTINVDDEDHGSVPQQLRDAASLHRRYPA